MQDPKDGLLVWMMSQQVGYEFVFFCFFVSFVFLINAINNKLSIYYSLDYRIIVALYIMKRTDYPKQICLVRVLLNNFTGTHFLYFNHNYINLQDYALL